MTQLNDIPTPLNANERLLYAMVVRQNIIIEQLSSIIDHLASKEKIAVTSNKSVETVSEVKQDVAPTVKRQTTRKKKEVAKGEE